MFALASVPSSLTDMQTLPIEYALIIVILDSMDLQLIESVWHFALLIITHSTLPADVYQNARIVTLVMILRMSENVGPLLLNARVGLAIAISRNVCLSVQDRHQSILLDQELIALHVLV